MYSAGTKGHLNTSDLVHRSGSTKPAAAATRVALALAVLSALLLIAARPAHAQTETVLYRFHKDGLDGKEPQSRLTPDGMGNLYGTTTYGGAFGYGTVFELSPNGGYGHRLWKETVLYSFTGGVDGRWPLYSPVVFDSLGNLTEQRMVAARLVKAPCSSLVRWEQAGRKSFCTAFPAGQIVSIRTTV